MSNDFWDFDDEEDNVIDFFDARAKVLSKKKKEKKARAADRRYGGSKDDKLNSALDKYGSSKGKANKDLFKNKIKLPSDEKED